MLPSNEKDNKSFKSLADYKLIKVPGDTVLGEGAFGKVYLAIDNDD